MAKSDDRPTGKRGSKMSMAAATDKLTELANNPMARSMLAAGLVAAAAALTTNQKVRQSAKKAGQDALDGAGAAADNASKIGAAIVTAATDAVRRLLASNDEPAATRKGSTAGRKSAASGKGKTAKTKAAKPAGRGQAKNVGAGKAAAANSTAEPTGKSAAKRIKTATSGRGVNGAGAKGFAAKAGGTKPGGAKRGRKSAAKPTDANGPS
jgi:hypothetical protein